MKRSTKGAIAGSVAALLLMGGVGTHAGWSGGDSVPGTALGSGHLSLTRLGCDGWLINGSVADPGTVRIAPGATLTQVCSFVVDAVGANLKATLSLTQPTVSATDPTKPGDGAFVTALSAQATYKDALGNTIGTTTKLSDDDKITATITVTLAQDATDAIEDADAALASVTVTATQV